MNDPEEPQQKLEQIYCAINKWMIARTLKLSPAKIEILLLPGSSSHNSFNDISYFSLGGKQVKVSKDVLSFGVVLDSSLTLRNNLAGLRKKVTVNLINISRIYKFIDQNCRLKLIYNLDLSSIDFCNSLFCEPPNKDLCPSRG